MCLAGWFTTVQTNSRILEFATRVISRADRDEPADLVLRQEFKSAKGLARHEAREIRAAVFAYFRWRSWLASGAALADQVSSAVALAERYSKRPESFSAPELVENAVPAWVSQEWTVTAAWVRRLQQEPPLWLRARPGQGRALARTLAKARTCRAEMMHDAVEYFGDKDLFTTSQFRSGGFEIQDLSSQATGVICAPAPGQIWWDACAGEGGKTLHLSDLMRNQGLIWATDRSRWKLERLKRRAARAGVFNYRIASWDGGPMLPTKTRFDGILVDAPCSGLGTWSRNPHARWTTTPSDVQELAVLQTQLLTHAAHALKPDGKLFYSVCTMTRSETVAIVEAVEKALPHLAPLPIASPLDTSGSRTHTVLISGEKYGGNDMFVAAWVRK